MTNHDDPPNEKDRPENPCADEESVDQAVYVGPSSNPSGPEPPAPTGDSQAPLTQEDLEAVAAEAVKITGEILAFFPHVPDPRISSKIENDSIWVEIEGDPSGRLIGRKGLTILAFQHVLGKIVSHKLKKRVAVHVDAEHYRQRHLEKLVRLTIQTADYVAATHTARALEPMPAADRRMVHITLKGRKDIVTVSEGKDPNRFVVIWPNQEE